MSDLQVVVQGQAASGVSITPLSANEVVVQRPVTQVVSLVTEGPQGPQGPPGTVPTLGTIPNVNTSGVVDRSLLFYDGVSAKFVADASVTTINLTDGGNF